MKVEGRICIGMRPINKSKSSIKTLIIFFIIITIIIGAITLSMSKRIREYYYNQKKEEAVMLAQSISIYLSNTEDAVNIAAKLLDENLLMSLNAVGSHNGNYSSELITSLAEELDLNEINIYNAEGLIEYSNLKKNIKWHTYRGHKAYVFMNSDDNILIEDIRKDAIGDKYYKYAYMKNPDGSFIQIGILEEKVYSIFDSFQIQRYLDKIPRNEKIMEIFAIDTDYIVSASTNQDDISLQIYNDSLKTDLGNGNIHSHIDSLNDDESIYEVYVPVNYEPENIIAFGIKYQMSDVIPLVRINTFNSISGLIVVYISLLFSVITFYRRNKKLEQLAFYDYLTKLPNRQALLNQLNDKANINNKAIFLIKSGDLRFLNQSFGYEYGDGVLKELGKRIKMVETKNIKLFRFTADKFVIYMENYKSKEEILSVVDKIKVLFKDPLIINNISQQIFLSIGIVEYKANNKTADNLLTEATIALNNIDNGEAITYIFFDDEMELIIQREELIEREIRTAIDEGDTSKIYLEYQPLVDLKTNEVIGFEALARMNSKQFGQVSPIEFIDIAERKQFIIPLSNFIFDMACEFSSSLVNLGYYDMYISVNISAIHLLQEDFATTVLNSIKRKGIRGHNIVLEITESTLMEKYEEVNERLMELRSNDLRIAIDDFGTGFSSFSRLTELNVDILKIDRDFIKDISNGNKNRLITKDIITIAHRLGVNTVAEGVENQEQKDYLIEHNCDILQGYLFSKPVPEDKAINLLNKHNESRNKGLN